MSSEATAKMPDASLVKQLVRMSSDTERVRSANVLHGGLQKRAPSSIVAIAASSWSLRRKLHGSSRFWRMRAGVTDFGITTTPRCKFQRSRTLAGETPCTAAIRATVGLVSSPALVLPPRPSGEYAVTQMPWPWQYSTSCVCGRRGWSSIWLTAGRMRA